MTNSDDEIKTLKTPNQSSYSSLNDADLLEMYRQMVLCRTLDERVWMLNRQGKAAIVASAQGHEAAQIGSVRAMRKGKDLFYIYYRDLAVLLSAGMTPEEIMLGFLAKAGEPMSNARQFPTQGAYRQYGLINLSNVVGTQIPQAVGAALASVMRGEDTTTIVYFGDGGASTGDCHEAMNFAGIHKLPIIFFCENNKYAISVPLSKQMAVDSVASRSDGYGMPGVVIDGCDIVSVYEATSAAAVRARAGQGPTLIEAMVERYLPHTSDDDDLRYRSKEEIKEARTHDPLGILNGQLKTLGLLTKEIDKALHEDAKRHINEATDFAEKAPFPETGGFHDHVYSFPGGASSPYQQY